MRPADLKDGSEDPANECGLVRVELRGLFKRWPAWGRHLLHVASNMCNVRSYFTFSSKPKPMTVRPLTQQCYVASNMCWKRRA